METLTSNNINIFKKLLKYNINNYSYIINENKELKLINKITNIEKKYKYFKYKIHHNDEIMSMIFIKTQIVYNFFNKIILNKKINCAKIYNNETLIGENMSEIKNVFNIYIDKFIYKFNYNDFLRLINNSLLNYDKTIGNNIINLETILFNPIKIKNPYTNIEFKKNVLYNFYTFCINNNLKITLLFQLFYTSNFNLIDFVANNENFITKKALFIYIKNLSNEDKHKLLNQSIIVFDNFIKKYISGFNISYLLQIFKQKIINLQENKIEYFTNIIYKYLLMIYYFNTKQYRNYVNHKIKIVYCFLHNKTVNFFEDTNNIIYLNNLNLENFTDLLFNNMDKIINQELDNINYMVSIRNLLTLRNNNEENLLDISNNSSNIEDSSSSINNNESTTYNYSNTEEDTTSSINNNIDNDDETGMNNNNIEISLSNVFLEEITNNFSINKINENKEKIKIVKKNKYKFININIKKNNFLKIIAYNLINVTFINLNILLNIYIMKDIYNKFK
jgi:hypothetical protein